MRRNILRSVALVLLFTLIGSSAMAATMNGLLDTAKAQGYGVSQKNLKSGTPYALGYEESTKGADKLNWSSDTRLYTVTARTDSAKLRLKALYLDFSRLYKWKALYYRLDKKVTLGYNVKGAEKSYKSLSAARKGVKTYVDKQTRAATQPPAASPTSGKYVLNTSTKKFHVPGCRDVAKMKAENKAYSSQTRAQIIAMGYSPCGHCKP